MASTNKTSNYELSQFLGTDKPAWLSDYNTDMSKIDAQMKLNADGVTAATGASTTNTTNIGTLSNLTTDEKTSLVAAVNEVDSHADTAQNTANTASTDAGIALTKISGIESALNLTAASPVTSNFTVVDGATATVNEGKITVAKNTEGSLCKVYGYLNIASTSSSGLCTIKLVDDSGLRPDENINVEGVALKTSTGGIGSATLNIKTTGEIDVTFNKSANIAQDIRIMACVIFVKSFGD